MRTNAQTQSKTEPDDRNLNIHSSIHKSYGTSSF